MLDIEISVPQQKGNFYGRTLFSSRGQHATSGLPEVTGQVPKLAVCFTCVFRWVQVYSPELDKRCRPYLRRTNKSYRVDETYINVKGESKYLYRTVDSTGQ